MNGIKMSDCKFYVNEEKRTVVCVIPNTKNMVMNFLYENFKILDDFDIYKIVEMPNSFMGKAVCADEDEWNEETGRMIAFSRAKNKCYTSFFKRASALVNAIDKYLANMMDVFNTFGLKLEEKQSKLEKSIESRINKKSEDA